SFQGDRVKTRGRRGIRGNSAKKNKSKITRIVRPATTPFGAHRASWVERSSVPRVFSRSSWQQGDRENCLGRSDRARRGLPIFVPSCSVPFLFVPWRSLGSVAQQQRHHYGAPLARQNVVR